MPSVSTAQRPVATRLAERTADSFSFDRYVSWFAVCAFLIRSGYTEREAEAILRSKHMRWAADAATGQGSRYGQCRPKNVADYIALQGATWKREVRTLTDETFSETVPQDGFDEKVKRAVNAYDMAGSQKKGVKATRLARMAAALRAAGVEN